MSKPESVKNDKWTDFPRQSYSILSDDFCHDKTFVAKAVGKSQKATINIKQTVSSKKDAWSVADEVKLWFDLPSSHSFYAKIKSNDYIKLHYDHGITEWKNKRLNIYASMNSNKLLQNLSFKLGVAHLGKTCHTDNRLKVDLKSKNEMEYYWYHRTMITKDKCKFGFLSVADLSKKVLQKNNLFLSYAHDDKHTVFLRTEVNGFRSKNPQLDQPMGFFDKVLLNYVVNIDEKSKAAVELAYDLKNKAVSGAEVVYQRKLEKNTTFKIGANKNMDMKLLVKRPVYGLESLANLSTGVGITDVIKGKPVFKTGFQLDLNL